MLLPYGKNVKIMAAGSGKSLCYQLLIVLHDGVAIVVNPLIYLIQDQGSLTTGKVDEKFINKVLLKKISKFCRSHQKIYQRTRALRSAIILVSC